MKTRSEKAADPNTRCEASEERWRHLHFENVPVGRRLTGSHGRYVAATPDLSEN